jgi:N-acetylmuramoyl-L-alanine amidase
VKRLQRALGFTGADVDGAFSKDTEKAVRAFQKQNGLKVDGKVGPATWSALGF